MQYKCRKRKCSGTGVLIPQVYQDMRVYCCTKCGRKWAIKERVKRSKK